MNEEKSELEPKQVFNFGGYQFDLKEDRVKPTPERWQNLQTKIQEIMSSPVCPVRNLMSLIGILTATEKQVHLGHLHMRPIQWHLKLESARDNGKDHPHSKTTPPTSKMVAGGKQCYHRSTITPAKTCATDLYRRIKRRVGRSLKQAHGTGKLVTSRKQTAHKLFGVKGSSSGFKRISGPLYQQHSPHSYRHHYSGCLHKQGRGNEVGPSVCPTMENSDLVYQKTGYSQSSTHPRPSEHDSRQAIQTESDHSNGMVPQSRRLPSNMPLVAPAHCGHVFHQVQQQAPTVCLTSPRPPGMGSGCSQPVMGRTGSIRFSTSNHLGQSGGEVAGLPMQQNHTDCTGMAQHALVLGSSGNVQSDSPVSAQHTQSSVSAIQPGPAQEPIKSESTCLAPRGSCSTN